MLILTADWHFKLGQKNVPRDWALSRYLNLFDSLPNSNWHVIAGDIFDKLPSLQELELYVRFLSQHCKWINGLVIFDGNHEATKRGQSFMPFIRDIARHIDQSVYYVLETEVFEFYGTNLEATIVPYTQIHKESTWKTIPQHLPVFTHVRGEIPPHVKPEIPLEWLDPFPTVFAGDLHSHSNCQRNIVYPGTPIGINFTRSRQKYGYIDIKKDWSWKWEQLDLPQLLRLKIENTNEIEENTEDHIIYEIEGDVATLKSIQDEKNLEKKIARTERKTLFKEDQGISEILEDYLVFVQSIPKNKARDIVKVFNDNIKKASVE